MRTIKIIVGIILPLTFLLSLLSNDFLAPSTQAAIITPTPTLTPDEADVAKLLTADFRDYCSAGTTSFKCFTPFAVKILDFLYDHPTHQRELLHQIIMLGRQGQLAGHPLNWLVEYWLEQDIRQPFDQAKGIPPAFEANFYLTYQKQRPTSLGEKWGEILTTDLDNNNKPDYLVMILYGSDVTNEIGEMYWLHESRSVYQLTQLPTNLFEGAIYPTEVIIQDVNNDGQLDLIYSVNTCGACHCFDKTWIVLWQDNQFVNLLPEDWTTSSRVKVEDTDKDGLFEVVTWPDGGDCLGEGPVLSYHVQHKLHQGQYIPIKQIANIEITSTWHIGWEDLQTWQEAQYLLHSYRLTESLTKFDFMATQPISSFEQVDIRPYALFYSGLIHILLDEPSLAQQSWQQVVQQFPYHPIAHDIQTLPHIAYNSHDLGKICNSLSNNWNDNRWMASNKAILEAKWEVYVSNQKNHLEYETWLKTQDLIDYDKERQNLPQFYIPYYYSFNFDWTHVCSPMFLLRLQQWRVELPLTQQAQQLNLTWQTLSADYDLNHDKQIDPIGFIEVGHKRYLYTFISQAKNYHPLAVTKPYPIEAIDVWDTDKYLYNLSFSITSTFQTTYTTKNNAPEILITDTSAYATQYIWQGSYFEAIRPTQTIYQKPIPSSSEPLAQALKLLFRDRKPQEVIKLLDQYVTSNDWDEAARLYLLGLALYYTNDTNRAYNISINLTNRYPDTGWAILAQEKVDHYKKHRFNHK